jgi:hypothetical protein
MVWGELRTKVHYEEGKEMVLIIIWQDQAVVRIMSTIHDGNGYKLRPRRRPKDSSTMKVTTRTIFDVPSKDDLLLKRTAKRFFASKLSLPVPEVIDDYNYNMNGVDRADQLRSEFAVNQITVRSWLPYFFWLLDSAIINSYLLWRWELEANFIGRRSEALRSHRTYREALIRGLAGPIDNIPSPYIRVMKGHKLRRPNSTQTPANRHISSNGRRQQCYYCRYKRSKGETREVEVVKTKGFCTICQVPLCRACFTIYHNC